MSVCNSAAKEAARKDAMARGKSIAEKEEEEDRAEEKARAYHQDLFLGFISFMILNNLIMVLIESTRLLPFTHAFVPLYVRDHTKDAFQAAAYMGMMAILVAGYRAFTPRSVPASRNVPVLWQAAALMALGSVAEIHETPQGTLIDTQDILNYALGCAGAVVYTKNKERALRAKHFAKPLSEA